MGYQIPANSPKATLPSGVQVAAALITITPPFGPSLIVISVFESKDGSWEVPSGEFAYKYEADGLYKAMVAAGGRVAFMKLVFARLNAFFARLYPTSAPPTSGEPKNEAEAEAAVIADLAAARIVIVNGSPVLQ